VEVYGLFGYVNPPILKTKTIVMKTKNLFIAFASLLIVFAMSFSSCSKTGVNNGDAIQVYLTDGPGDFEAVNLDIQKVEVKLDNDDKHKKDDRFGDNDDDKDDHTKKNDDFGEWVDLAYTPAVVDVLKLRNGVEKMLADGNVTGTVRKIRITLGANNTVVKAGVTYTLNLVGETTNFLYIKLNDEHRERGAGNGLKVWVDFDIANSISEVNGKFYLRPVLRPFCNVNFAGAEGRVLPEGIKPTVTFSNGLGFNAVALPAPNGEFKIRGLREGTYTVTYTATGYVNQTKTVTVTKGKEIKMDVVTLVK
jgi:hypothetical protein